MIRKILLLVVLSVASLGLFALLVIYLSWEWEKWQIRRSKLTWEMEARTYLYAIRNCQEAYFSRNGVYVECKPSSPGGGADAKPDPWVDADGFEVIGFAPDPGVRVRYQYAVEVSDDKQSYAITATGDLDEDGEKSVLTLDPRAAGYLKPAKSGDDY